MTAVQTCINLSCPLPFIYLQEWLGIGSNHDTALVISWYYFHANMWYQGRQDGNWQSPFDPLLKSHTTSKVVLQQTKYPGTYSKRLETGAIWQTDRYLHRECAYIKLNTSHAFIWVTSLKICSGWYQLAKPCLFCIPAHTLNTWRSEVITCLNKINKLTCGISVHV